MHEQVLSVTLLSVSFNESLSLELFDYMLFTPVQLYVPLKPCLESSSPRDTKYAQRMDEQMEFAWNWFLKVRYGSRGRGEGVQG